MREVSRTEATTPGSPRRFIWWGERGERGGPSRPLQSMRESSNRRLFAGESELGAAAMQAGEGEEKEQVEWEMEQRGQVSVLSSSLTTRGARHSLGSATTTAWARRGGGGMAPVAMVATVSTIF